MSDETEKEAISKLFDNSRQYDRHSFKKLYDAPFQSETKNYDTLSWKEVMYKLCHDIQHDGKISKNHSCWMYVPAKVFVRRVGDKDVLHIVTKNNFEIQLKALPDYDTGRIFVSQFDTKKESV